MLLFLIVFLVSIFFVLFPIDCEYEDDAVFLNKDYFLFHFFILVLI